MGRSTTSLNIQGWVEQRLALLGFAEGLASQDKAKPNSLNWSFFHRLDDIYVGSDAPRENRGTPGGCHW